MKTAIISAILLLIGVEAGLAESCHEKFVRILTDQADKGSVKIYVVQDIKGGMKSENYHYSVKTGHWMTEMIKPANMSWSLGYNNTMYTSSNKGKSWKKIRAFDSEKNKVTAVGSLKKNAETTRNPVCGEDKLDGIVHDTIEADYNTLQNFKTENHHKYWVNRKTGFISKAFYRMKGKGFESSTVQIIKPAPGLTLPTPE